MILLPAIDLIEGKCVRLKKGDFSTSEKVADDPLETAKRFEAAGASWIHIVDLDAARGKASENLAVVAHIAENTGLHIELGGGMKDMSAIDNAFEIGVSRVVIGSAAVTNLELLRQVVEKYQDKIAVGIDSLHSKVRISGWCESTDIYTSDLAKTVELAGVKYIAFTDISKDGMLSGPNFQELKELNDSSGCRIIASGGVSTIEDIEVLSDMGLYGAILGKALYTGDIDLEKAVALCIKNSL